MCVTICPSVLCLCIYPPNFGSLTAASIPISGPYWTKLKDNFIGRSAVRSAHLSPRRYTECTSRQHTDAEEAETRRRKISAHATATHFRSYWFYVVSQRTGRKPPRPIHHSASEQVADPGRLIFRANLSFWQTYIKINHASHIHQASQSRGADICCNNLIYSYPGEVGDSYRCSTPGQSYLYISIKQKTFNAYCTGGLDVIPGCNTLKYPHAYHMM